MQRDRLRIGEVARKSGVNIQTLRYYERRGLVEAPGRTAAGYRLYGLETVRLIRFIRRAQDLGFTLKEIKELVALRDTRGRKRSEVRALAETKVRHIDQKLSRLQAMRSALQTMVDMCVCRRSNPACPILEALDDARDEMAADPAVRGGQGAARS
jgi:Hg(II)-responsive transcriptional regulator